MPSSEPMGPGFRGVYRDAAGDKHKAPVVRSRLKAMQDVADMEAKVRAGTWRDPSAA